jgi:hypothetical protein
LIKKPFKTVFDFYLYSNLHVALCGIALVGISQIILGLQLRMELFIFVFCGSFFLYNLQRLPSAFPRQKIESKFSRHKWNLDHRYFLAIATATAALGAGWSFFQLYHRSQLIALLPAILSLAYAFPVIPAKNKWKRLREIPSTKIFIITLVWGMICVLLPATASDPTGLHWLSAPVLIWFFTFCCMIFSLTITFDIRDYYYDGQKLKTIPALVGIKKAIGISLCALVLFAAGSSFLFWNFSTGTVYELIGIFLWCVIAGIFIVKSNPSRKEYYFSFFIDGLLILLWVFVFVASRI